MQPGCHFDPYHEWLGIPPAEQPPNHYRLLGLSQFEGNQQAILNAADRQLAHVRRFAAGPRGEFAHPLLNQIAQAQCVLCDPAQKSAYDAWLSRQSASPPPVPPPKPAETPPMIEGVERPVYVPRRLYRRHQPAGGGPGFAVMALMGGVAGIAIALFILWAALGLDPLGIFKALSPGGLVR